MSIMDSMSERAKYTYLLHLSQEQIRAVENGDMLAFDRILLAKKTIIESLCDAQSLIRDDPSVLVVIDKIKESEIAAQSILQTRMGEIKKKLTNIQSQRTARKAYRRYVPAMANASCGGFMSDRSLPRFIDRMF